MVLQHMITVQSKFLRPSGGVALSSRHKKVNCLVGAEHLSGPLCSGDGGQLLGVVARVEGSASPAGRLPLAPRRQHVAHLAVKVRVGGQPIENQVLDAFDGVPAEGKRQTWKQCLLKTNACNAREQQNKV